MTRVAVGRYSQVQTHLRAAPRRWLVTGCAGFIGSNLVEALLELDQHVVGLDNFATGYPHNLDEVRANVSAAQWSNFRFVQGDIRDSATCADAVAGAEFVLHQAALGSVPRSLADPVTTNDVNISGFLNMLVAARDAKVQAFVYAASSSTYGDHPALPKVEDQIGKPLSPYAVTKYVNEMYADVFARAYDFKTIGLRYFNVFGKRQDPEGAYAAVIPKWIAAMLKGEAVSVNGDGETSRDFCFVDNAVQANILAAMAADEGTNQVYNVAVNARTSLNVLHQHLVTTLAENNVSYALAPSYRDFRAGDVRHSQADILKAQRLLGYQPTHTILQGLQAAMPWYLEFCAKSRTS